MDAYQLKIALHDSEPLIWRRVLVPDCLNFSQLAMVINESMGWKGKHLCDFVFDELNLRIEDPPEEDDTVSEEAVLRASDTYLRQVFAEKTKFVYTYDYGDNWLHDVTVEKIVSYYPYKYPQVVKYQGDCPPEDCGGLSAYYRDLSNVTAEYDIRGDIIPYDMEEINNFFQKTLYLNMARIDRRNVYELYEEIYGEEKPGLYGKVPVAAKKSVTEILADMEKDMFAGFGTPRPEKEPTWPCWEMKEVLATYDEENIRQIIENKNIDVSKNNSHDAVLDKLARFMTEEDEIESYFYILSDEEDDALRKYIASAGEDVPEDFELFSVFFLGDYLGYTDEDGLMLPREVVEAYKKVSEREDYHDLRHKRHWLACCVKMANKLYGITPGDILQELVDKDPAYTVKRQDLWAEVRVLPQDVCHYEIKDDTMLSTYINSDNRDQILVMQGDIPFYKPTREEILAGPFAGYDHRLLRKLTKFLQRETYLESQFSVRRIQEALLDLAIGGLRGGEATDMLLEHANIKFSRSKRAKLDNLLLEISYHLPTIVLRGFKPSDMTTSRLMSLQDNALKAFAANKNK